MSDAETSAAPRRSQRERKQATQFTSFDSSQRSKRKRSEGPSDDEGSEPERSQQEEDDSEPEADVEEENYTAPKPPKPKAKVAEKAAPKPRKKPVPTTRKPRGGKVPGIAPARRRPRKGAAEFDAEQVAKETKITNDNPLFNAIMNPSAALQSTAEDFLESLTHSPAAAQAELINCVLRACGCNHTIDGDEAVDYDGVVDALDNITEALKQDDTPIYPLTSKLPAFRPFRASLSEFLSRLTSSAAELGQLYKTDLMTTLQAWVVAMSSSQLRSFRHTATVVALEVETALCEVAATVEKEAEVVSRQREGERKRKKGKGEPTTAREKQLETKAGEVRERRTKLAEYLKEFVDGVFVHRYRDLDPNIRAECVRAMGLWFSKYPAHFLDGTYLRYVGWVLSDANTHVRLEAVRALSLAYAQTEYVGVGALQHFTERFKPRLVEMAMGDIELAVRVAVVQVLQAIDEHGLLEDEQREKLCLLVFDEEPKMRKAVSGFVKGVWQENVEERLVGKRPNATDKKRAGIKSLATLLVQWGRALGKGKGLQDEDVDMDNDDDDRSDDSKRNRKKEVVSLVGMESKGRTALAVEALWDDVEPVADWDSLLSILLLDHSAPGEESSTQGGSSRKGKHSAGDGAVDEAWRLEEVEEGILLEVLLASLRKSKADTMSSKKGEDETVTSDITRALIKGLPRLFVKYQTDAGRMSDVLQLPQLMSLDMYLEMRMMTAYSNLWDDVTKQFLSHSAPVVLTNAVATIRHMMDATSLSNTNSTKILELEEELSTTLRDAIKGRDELDIATFSEDEVIALGAICARLATLAGTRDMTAWMEEDEGGKQSSAWDIVSALAERGKLGYREEETMIDQALNLLTLYVIWKARGLTNNAEPTQEEAQYRDKLKESRDSLLEKLLEFTLGTQSNTSEGVKRAAFQNLINLHILFAPPQPGVDAPALPTAALPLTLDDENQFRCATFVQAEIERYAEELEELSPLSEEESSDGSDKDLSDAEEQPNAKKGRKGKGKQPARQDKPPDTSRVPLEREYIFMGIVTTFLRAVRAGAIHFRHSAVLLTHYGRLGPSFDLCAKVIVDILREEGLYKSNGEEVAAIAKHSLRESFQLFLDGVAPSEEHTVALAKLLATCFLIRGAQLAVVRRLDSKFVVDIHTSSLSWICKRIGQYESSSNKKARNKAVLLFKALSAMLASVDARNSLTIKAHLEQALAQAKIEVPATSKIWDAYRAYEKRLTGAREKGTTKTARAKKTGKTTEAVTTDEEDMEAEEVEEIMGVAASAKSKPRAKPGPKPKPKPKPRARRKRADTDNDGDNDEDDDGNETEQPAPTTPKARPKRRTRKSPSPPPAQRSPSLSEPPLTPEPDEVPATDEEVPATPEADEVPETPEQDVPVTPIASSRKRGRSPDEENDEDEEQPEASSSPRLEDSPALGQMQIRRKRVRH